MSTEKEQSPNEITSVFNITKKDVNKEIRIMNSYEETLRAHPKNTKMSRLIIMKKK